jgi:hypothetical protein
MVSIEEKIHAEMDNISDTYSEFKGHAQER